MADVYVKTVSGGENTSPSSTDAVEIDDGVNSEWTTLANLVKGAVAPGTLGNQMKSDGTVWTSARPGRRTYTTTSIAGTPGNLTPDVSAYDYYEITAQAAELNVVNPNGTPVLGDQIIIAITSDATPRALTYGTSYVAKGGVALPSTTVASKTTTLGFIWNGGLGKFNLLAVGQEA